MTDTAEQTTAPPRNRRLIIAAVAAVLLVGAGLLVWTLIPSDHRVVGVIYVKDDADVEMLGAGNCRTLGGYADISTGSQVQILNGNDEVLAYDTLQQGRLIDGQPGVCKFDFVVRGVPGGEDVYRIKVGSGFRPPYTVREDQLDSEVGIAFGT